MLCSAERGCKEKEKEKKSIYENRPRVPIGLPLPRSYNHLLFNPTLALPVLIPLGPFMSNPSNMLSPNPALLVLKPNGLLSRPPPRLDLRPSSAFRTSGLAFGLNGEPPPPILRRPAAPSLAPLTDPLNGLTESGVPDREESPRVARPLDDTLGLRGTRGGVM